MRSIAVGTIVLSASIPLVGAAEAQQGSEVRPTREGDQVKPKEGGLAKVIEQENERLNRLLRGICRGC